MMEAKLSSQTSFIQEPHGVTSQKAAFFIVTIVETSDLTRQRKFSLSPLQIQGVRNTINSHSNEQGLPARNKMGQFSHLLSS
jgi:hypothetical protein